MGSNHLARKTGTQFSTGYFVPEIWSKDLLKIFDDRLIMKTCINEDWSGEIKQKGDIVYVAGLGEITINDYIINQGDITVQQLSETQMEIKIDQMKYFGFGLDRVDVANQQVPVLDKYADRAATKIAYTIDRYIYTTMAANTGSALRLGADTTGNAITLTKTNIYDYFVDCRKLLQDSLALNGGKTPFMVVNTGVEALLLKCDQFIHATAKGDKTVSTGEIGTVAGFTVKTMTGMPATTGGNRALLFGTDEACTYASKIAETEKVKPPLQFREVVKGLFLYGSKVIYTNCLGRITVTNR